MDEGGVLEGRESRIFILKCLGNVVSTYLPRITPRATPIKVTRSNLFCPMHFARELEEHILVRGIDAYLSTLKRKESFHVVESTSVEDKTTETDNSE